MKNYSRKIEEYRSLFNSEWVLFKYKTFLGFVYSEEWYWYGNSNGLPIGPYDRQTANRIESFICHAKNNKMITCASGTEGEED